MEIAFQGPDRRRYGRIDVRQCGDRGARRERRGVQIMFGEKNKIHIQRTDLDRRRFLAFQHIKKRLHQPFAARETCLKETEDQGKMLFFSILGIRQFRLNA